MIFIVRVSGSERLSYSHKIFITIKIFDSMKKFIYIFLTLCAAVSCMTPFDLDYDDTPVIFLEAFPGADAEYINSNKTDELEKQKDEKVSFGSLIKWIFQQITLQSLTLKEVLNKGII